MTTTSETTANGYTWIGKDIKRREDPALLMGTAQYTNDVNLLGCCTPPCCAARTLTPGSSGSTPVQQRRSLASMPF